MGMGLGDSLGVLLLCILHDIHCRKLIMGGRRGVGLRFRAGGGGGMKFPKKV